MTQDALQSFRDKVTAAAEALVTEGRAANARFEAAVEEALSTCAVDQLKPSEQDACKAIIVEITMAAAQRLEVAG